MDMILYIQIDPKALLYLLGPRSPWTFQISTAAYFLTSKQVTVELEQDGHFTMSSFFSALGHRKPCLLPRHFMED